MGGAAWAVYGLVYQTTASNTLGVGAAILVAVVVYALLVVLLQVLNRDDLSLMPKGDKIARILRVK
jgi:stage V sporulation protein B